MFEIFYTTYMKIEIWLGSLYYHIDNDFIVIAVHKSISDFIQDLDFVSTLVEDESGNKIARQRIKDVDVHIRRHKDSTICIVIEPFVIDSDTCQHDIIDGVTSNLKQQLKEFDAVCI